MVIGFIFSIALLVAFIVRDLALFEEFQAIGYKI